MINILNITLFLQIINFYIAYLVLSRLIFKPAMMFSQQQKAAEQKLVNELEAEKNILLVKEKNKQAELIKFQKKIKQQAPKLDKSSLKAKTDIAYKRNSNEIMCLIGKVKNLILKEVPRVR